MSSSTADSAIQAAVAEAQRAWPEIRLPIDDFEAHLSQRRAGWAQPGESAAAAPRHLADLYLAWACTRGDEQALRALEEHHLRPLASALARIDPSPDFADEVLQRVRQKVLLPDGERAPRLALYGGRGPLRGFLRAAVMRTALNLRRDQRFAAGEGGPGSDVRALELDPEFARIDAEHRQILKEELAAALSSLALRQRNLLRLHLIDGASIDRLALVFSVHRATVARWIAAAREELLASMRRRLARRMGIAEEQVASQFGALASNIDLSLSRLLPRAELASVARHNDSND